MPSTQGYFQREDVREYKRKIPAANDRYQKYLVWSSGTDSKSHQPSIFMSIKVELNAFSK